MKTYGLKLKKRQGSPPIVREIEDKLHENPLLPSITEYIDKLIEESPELLQPPPVPALKVSKVSKSKFPQEGGMIFVPLPSQVIH